MKSKKLTEDQKKLIKIIRKKYRKFRGLYFRKKHLGNNMEIPKIKKVKIVFNPNLKKTWGRCYRTYIYKSKYWKAIEFNYEKVSRCSEKELNSIIIHEMLHFIARDRHGKHFKYLINYVNRMAEEVVVGRYVDIDNKFPETFVDITERP